MNLRPIIVASLIAARMEAAELHVDWGFDVSGFGIEAPHLQLRCFSNQTHYTITGERLEDETLYKYRYKVPEEVKGRCLLSMYLGSLSSGFDAGPTVNITDAQATLTAAFPRRSAVLEFHPNQGVMELGEVYALRFFRLATDGLPDPHWVHVSAIKFDASAPTPVRRLIPYAEAGRYICYVGAIERKSPTPRVIYAKAFDIASKMLSPHHNDVAPEELLTTGKPIPIRFSEKDRFDGVVGVEVLPQARTRMVDVDKSGNISAEYNQEQD